MRSAVSGAVSEGKRGSEQPTRWDTQEFELS
jgi:hypothetical protein